MNRRIFLSELGRYAAMCAMVPNQWRVTGRPRFANEPFSLGVASGDPTSTGATLWTRLAPRPLEPHGGMEGQRVSVGWELAHDEGFGRVVQRGTATAAPELSHSIHIDLNGLDPDRWYFYRFTAGDARSPVGRVRTAPAAAAATPLRFAFASCQHFEQGYFTAYRHMAREELDLVVHLGDYIYEYAAIAARVRRHQGSEILDIDDYRQRYAQYKSDPLLQAAHAHCPWVVTWDDHEVDNNYAGSIGENGMESDEQMRARRAAGYQAWWEHQPVRVPRVRSWADLNIARAIEWGSLARFSVVDTRQYRSDQPCNDGSRQVPCGEWSSPAQTVLGEAQERWLLDGISASRARWQVLANQIMVAPYDERAGAEMQLSMDQWSGYPVARDRLLGEIARRAPNRTVVLTGDIHSNWVNEIRSSFSDPRAPVVAAEFVGTSISSGGDGSERTPEAYAAMLAENPHLKWQNSRRGYVSCTVAPDSWRTDFRTVPFVTRPDAPLETPTSWLVTHGRPGIQRV